MKILKIFLPVIGLMISGMTFGQTHNDVKPVIKKPVKKVTAIKMEKGSDAVKKSEKIAPATESKTDPANQKTVPVTRTGDGKSDTKTAPVNTSTKTESKEAVKDTKMKEVKKPVKQTVSK